MALLLAGCAGVPPQPAAGPPNLVLVIGDDQGFADFGFMGSPLVRTPSLDRLAAEGTLFPMGYTTASLCRPALLSLLTGLHPLQFRARQQVLEQRLAEGARYPDRVAQQASQRTLRGLATLPRLLAARGYASFQGGKYWEGHFASAGFTHGVGSLLEGVEIGRSTMHPVYEFVDAQRDRPFLLWFAPMLPHLPFDASPAQLELYAGADLPADTRGYFANATRFDSVVGELLRFLDARGLRERTLVVFLVDNGWQARGFNAFGNFRDGPHGKYSLYELGFRTPVVFRFPGRIPAGRVQEGLVTIPDVVATLLRYAGSELPPGLEGQDLRPVLEGGAEPAREAVIAAMDRVRPALPIDPRTGEPAEAEGPGGSLLRTSRWYYIWYEDRPHELYDMADDPEQERDVADRYPELTEQFRGRIRAWQQRMTELPAL